MRKITIDIDKLHDIHNVHVPTHNTIEITDTLHPERNGLYLMADITYPVVCPFPKFEAIQALHSN